MRSTLKTFLCLLALAALAAATQSASAQQPTRGDQIRASVPTLETIVTRMEEAQQKNRQNYRPYTMTREYKLFGAQEDNPKSEVLADVSFVPPNRKTFKIERSTGNKRGVSLVRDVLEKESEFAASQSAPGAIDRHNYDFNLLQQEVLQGQRCWVLELIPKHDEKALVRGKVWVDQDTYLVHKIDGDMAKSPSWWLKNVHTTVQFGNAAGMWLQTQTRAEADVRVFGRHIFTAQAVKVETGDQVASTFSTRPPNLTKELAMTARRQRTRSVPSLIGATVVP